MNRLKITIVLMMIILILSLSSFCFKFNNLDNQIFHLNGFSLSYNETHEQPNWVFYRITKEDIICEVKAKRKNKFKEDTAIPTGSATIDDYKKSGYDRGHLKSSADESCDQSQMDETFLMSNMSPQVPEFNRGIWKSLESHVRDLALLNDSIYVYTAGVLINGLPTIGNNKVTVPKNYYKIIYIFNNSIVSTESYVIPNINTYDLYSKYNTSISTIEQLTNIDFPDTSMSFTFPK